MNTGIKPDETFKAEFDELKMKKVVKCMIVSISSSFQLEIVFKGEKDFSYKDLPDHLPIDDCRYVFCDFDFETNENPPRKSSKLIMLTWCPDIAKSKDKFTYSSSAGNISSLLGVQKIFQVSDFAGLDYDNIRKNLIH